MSGKRQGQGSGALLEVPLSRLSVAPENVRQTPVNDEDQKVLEASIEAHGLLSSLVVRRGRPGHYLVSAGRRRFQALESLRDRKVFGEDDPVPCRLVPKGQAVEVSLAENVARVPLDPADQVVAFRELHEAGTTIPKIAARFGCTEHLVHQRLRLGGLADEVLDLYREGRCGLAVLKAFALTPDHDRQLKVLRAVTSPGQAHNVQPYQVQNLILEDKVSAGSRIAKFVGLETYEAAGGQVLRDLFADESRGEGIWLEDLPLLKKLADKRLAQTATELEGRRAWVEVRDEFTYWDREKLGEVKPRPGKPTEEESAESSRIEARIDELVKIDQNLDDGEDLDDELREEWDRLEERRDAIDEAVEARRQFGPKQREYIGAVVTVGHNGELKVHDGLVKPKDKKKARMGESQNGTGSSSPSMSNPQTEAMQSAGLSNVLGDDLRAIRTTVVKAHLARDFELAFDLAAFELAVAAFRPTSGIGMPHYPAALAIDHTKTDFRPHKRREEREFAEASPGEALHAVLHDELELGWIEIKDPAERWEAFRKLALIERENLFAAAIARTVKGQLSVDASHRRRPQLEDVIEELDIPWQKVRPTEKYFWTRLSAPQILEIAGEVIGKEWVETHRKLKKGALVKAVAAAFNPQSPEDVVDGSPETYDAIRSWTMPGLAPEEEDDDEG